MESKCLKNIFEIKFNVFCRRLVSIEKSQHEMEENNNQF